MVQRLRIPLPRQETGLTLRALDQLSSSATRTKLQSLCSTTGEAAGMRSPRATPETSPSCHNQRMPVRSNEDPCSQTQTDRKLAGN